MEDRPDRILLQGQNRELAREAFKAKLKAYSERQERIISGFVQVIKDNRLDEQTGFSDRDLAHFILSVIYQTQILTAATNQKDNNNGS